MMMAPGGAPELTSRSAVDCQSGASGEPLITLSSATAAYDGRAVLSDFDFTIRRGERVAVMGRSGAGKSTLLGLLYAQRPAEIALIPQAAALVKTLSVFHNVFMGRLDRHTTLYNLRTLAWPAPAELGAVGAVLQDVDMFEKLYSKAGALSGGQQQRVSVARALYNLRTLAWPAPAELGAVGAVLQDVDMFEKLYSKAGALSGGQQQRVSVARALYNGRPILLGDEPVSALDRVQGAQILSLLRQRHETLVLVMHDIPLALEHSDRIVVLDGGRKIIDAPSVDLTPRDLLGRFEGGGS